MKPWIIRIGDEVLTGVFAPTKKEAVIKAQQKLKELRLQREARKKETR